MIRTILIYISSMPTVLFGWHKRLKIEGVGGFSNYPSYESIKSLSDGRYIASGSRFSDGGPSLNPLVSLISNSGTVNNSYGMSLTSMGSLVIPGLDVLKSGDTDSGFVICGYLDSDSISGDDFCFIASADLTNTEASRRTWKVSTQLDEDEVYLYSVCAASDGTFIAAGTSNGVLPMNDSYNTVLLRVDPSETAADALIWQKSIGFTSGDEAFYELIETPDGHFIAVGEADNQVTGSSGKDGWIVKFNSGGNGSLGEGLRRSGLGYFAEYRLHKRRRLCRHGDDRILHRRPGRMGL